MAKEKGTSQRLWKDTTEIDFIDENDIVDVNIPEYNTEIMTLFSANINYARQLIKHGDGLKNVNRRILTVMNIMDLKYNKKAVKSANVVGISMTWHPHADGSIYNTLIMMSQPWKQLLPPVEIIGGKGTADDPEGYSHMRYTECRLSRYGWECFFEDYDPNCVEMTHNYAKDEPEPVVLPTKYPNVLINGGTGIAVGNTYAIPPFRPEDVVGLVKKLMKNPYAKDVVLIPDIPTGCDIIDDGGSIAEMCETGKGVLNMRAVIDITESTWSPTGSKRNERPVWELTIRAVPWMVSLSKVKESILKLMKEKAINILAISDNTQSAVNLQTGEVEQEIECAIIIDHNLDPYQVRQLLFTKTELQKAQSIDFNVVTDTLKVARLNLRDLCLGWIDNRREYKRRSYNRKLRDTMADISFYEIMIDITSPGKIEKTTKILMKSSQEEQVDMLVEHGHMTTHQAGKVLNMKLGVLSKDAHNSFKQQLIKAQKRLDEIKEILRSEKKIDEIIIEELGGLKKFYMPRKSNVINLNDEKIASDQKVALVVTKKGKVKKIPDHGTSKRTSEEIRDLFNGVKHTMGAFDQYDYPTLSLYVHNYDAVTFIDSLGRYSTIPVSIIPNTETSNTGYKLYDYTKLDGEIIHCFESSTPAEDAQQLLALTGAVCNQVFLTAQGMIKQVPLEEFAITGSTKKVRNSKCMKLKDNDTLVWTGPMLTTTNIMIFTRKGEYAYVNAGNIPMSTKNTMGNIGVKCADNDSCVGCCVIDDSPYLVIVTAKGCVKRVETDFLGEPGKRMRSSYLASIDDSDDIIACITARDDEELVVVAKSEIRSIPIGDIPIIGRKGKPKKMIPVAIGDVISTVYTRKMQD